MELIPLPQVSESSLLERSVSARAILAIRLVVTCLREACETVAEDTGSDRYDDSTSEGQLRWRRCHNRVRHLLDDGLVPGLEDVVADISDNALVVRVDESALSFYSARNGIDQPDLSGTSKTKGRVVNEMQLQLRGLDPPQVPRRLVIVYEADDDGLIRAAAGLLQTETQWHWRVSTYERTSISVADGRNAAVDELPRYDEQPSPELPDMEVFGEIDAVDREERGLGGAN